MFNEKEKQELNERTANKGNKPRILSLKHLV